MRRRRLTRGSRRPWGRSARSRAASADCTRVCLPLAAAPRDPAVAFARHAEGLFAGLLAACRARWVDPKQTRMLVTAMLHRLASTLQVKRSEWEMALWAGQAGRARSAAELQSWALQTIGALTTFAEVPELRLEIRKVVTQTQANPAANYDLTWAADVAGLHPNYFSAIFREETGQTFIEYLSRLRMERAAAYLREGVWKTHKIAEMVGVPNYRTFFEMFRPVIGTSPTEFKRQAGG